MGAHGSNRFPHPPALCLPALGRGRRAQARRPADELSRQRAAARRGGARPPVQRPRRRIRRQPRDASRKGAALAVGARTRPQEAPPDVDYLFAPLKHARLDYMAQKAVEMGARALRPVLTRHTQVARVNLDRLRGKRDRGLRTMRRDLDSGDRAGRAARRSAPALAGRAAAGVLRRGGGGGEPARRARRARGGGASAC